MIRAAGRPTHSRPTGRPPTPHHWLTTPRRPETNWFSVALDLVATIGVLWDITWFTDALGLQPGGATTAAAQATKMLRFLRVIRALEAFAAAIARRANYKALAEGKDDRLAPSNVGHRLRDAALQQVRAAHCCVPGVLSRVMRSHCCTAALPWA